MGGWGLEPGNYILFLGRFSPEKNCELLVQAYQQMDTPVKLVLAGGSSHSDSYVKRLRAQQMLALYTGEPVEIYDGFDDPPYFFEVKLTLSSADPALLQSKQQIARAIIDQEKPAHTFYALQIAVPAMRLVSEALHEQENAPLLFLGKNTLLGTTIPTP